MVELGVGQHGDVGIELEQRAVGLVGLDHDPLALAPAGVGAGRAQLAADHVGGIEARAAQRVDDHRRGGGLAVGAGHRDAALERGDLGQQVGAVQLAAARPPGARGCRAGPRSSRRPRRRRGRWRRRARSPARSRARAGARCSSTRRGQSRVTWAPRARATSARPLIPAPPMPTKCSRREDQSARAGRVAGRQASRSSTTTGISRSVFCWYSS